MLNIIKSRLKGKVIVLGIGNTLRSDDGAGSIMARRLKDKVLFKVWDVGVGLENYLGKIIKEKPDTIVLIDAVDFGGLPGELKILETQDVNTVNLFSTHNASILLTINYLQSNLKVDIIILIIQPKYIALSDKLTPEVSEALDKLEKWFSRLANNVKY